MLLIYPGSVDDPVFLQSSASSDLSKMSKSVLEKP